MLAKNSGQPESVRVYLCGPVTIESRGRVIRDAALAGRQGRLLFAFLLSRRGVPVSKADLVRALWGDDPPASAETALNAVVSKLRRALRTLGLAPPHGIVAEVGTYRCTLPALWLDVDCARASLDRAEGAWRLDHLSAAWANGNVAAAIARRPFLAEESRPWVLRERERLNRVWRRATLLLSQVSTRNGEFELAIQHAAEATLAEPFDEVACQTLMRAQAAAGNRAEALRTYARCRTLFRDELGTEPSEQTARVFLQILQS